jgi:hypothetical protein
MDFILQFGCWSKFSGLKDPCNQAEHACVPRLCCESTFIYRCIALSRAPDCGFMHLIGGVHCWDVDGVLVRARIADTQSELPYSATTSKNSSTENDKTMCREKEQPTSVQPDGRDSHDSRQVSSRG